MAKYFLYYAGLDSKQGVEQIGLAVSKDGKIFNRASDTPIIPLGTSGSFDRAQTSNPCVIFDEEKYRMWYQGKSMAGIVSICYAESHDGVQWKGLPQYVFSPAYPDGQIEYRYGYQHPHVLREGNLYRMWFSVQAKGKSTISYAESKDGYTWQLTASDVLIPNMEWEGSYLYYPFVRKCTDTLYEMYYTGRAKGLRWQTGRATSGDGHLWARDKKTLLIPPIVYPFIFRRVLEILPFTTTSSLNGSGSPFIFSIENVTYALMHDVGKNGRLSIGLYQRDTTGRFSKFASNILGGAPNTWDAYFQADPYLLIHE